MPTNRNTLMRIRTIDGCLQRRQRLWTIEDLRQACEDALFEYEGIGGISVRTIQRDIELMRSDKLGYNAPIIVKDRKYYTYEDPEYSITQLPLSKQDLAELSSAIDIIRQYQGFSGMHGQEDLLTRMQDKVQQQESRKQVVYIETNSQLKGLNFLSILYNHIVAKNALKLTYHSFRSRHDIELHLSPYVLKEFNNRWFLLSYNNKRDDIQTTALDRIVDIEKDENYEYMENTFFDPEEYLSSMVGVTRDLNSTTTEVRIKVDNDQAPYILTKPLHCSQRLIQKHKDGSITISLHVVQNFELVRAILGYGSHVEVLSPQTLRNSIAQHIMASYEKYHEF